MNKKFEYVESNLAKLKPYEYFHFGPVILNAPERKFKQKFLTREEYSSWIDNDIRTFG
jgi:hypothetical protein